MCNLNSNNICGNHSTWFYIVIWFTDPQKTLHCLSRTIPATAGFCNIYAHRNILFVVVVSFGSGSGTLCRSNKDCKYPLRQGVVIMLVRIYNTSTSTA